MNLPDHDLLSLKMALRNGLLTKLWTHDDVGEEYSTLSITRDMGRNMMSGAPVLRWPTLMPSTNGKTKMGQRFETHSIFSSGEGCKPGPTDTDLLRLQTRLQTPTTLITHQTPLHYVRYTLIHPTLQEHVNVLSNVFRNASTFMCMSKHAP